MIQYSSLKTYFQVVNFNTVNAEYDPESLASLREYDEGEYNNELWNDYFENVKFHVFYTKHGYFRNPEMYVSPQKIQNFYAEAYEEPFFFDTF